MQRQAPAAAILRSRQISLFSCIEGRQALIVTSAPINVKVCKYRAESGYFARHAGLTLTLPLRRLAE